MNLPIDPASPVPLYHQIAEALRYRIATGRFDRSRRLPPVREAAGLWGVNLHTVRRAYEELARSGLVEIGRRGTRVLPSPRRSREDERLSAFVARIVRQARESHGLSAEGLARILADWREPTAPPHEVYFVECSESQAEGHAREIEERFEVTVRPWALTRPEPPATGVMVATYFHYNDIRRRWPDRLEDVVFVTIRPDPALAHDIAAESASRTRSLIVCERDEETARNIAADLSLSFPPGRFGLEPRATREPGQVLAESRRRPVLFSPRVWAELSAEERQHPRAREIRYTIVPRDLDSLGDRFQWSPRVRVASSAGRA